MTVADLGARMPASEVVEWQAYLTLKAERQAAEAATAPSLAPAPPPRRRR